MLIMIHIKKKVNEKVENLTRHLESIEKSNGTLTTEKLMIKMIIHWMCFVADWTNKIDGLKTD